MTSIIQANDDSRQEFLSLKASTYCLDRFNEQEILALHVDCASSSSAPCLIARNESLKSSNGLIKVDKENFVSQSNTPNYETLVPTHDELQEISDLNIILSNLENEITQLDGKIASHKCQAEGLRKESVKLLEIKVAEVPSTTISTVRECVINKYSLPDLVALQGAMEGLAGISSIHISDTGCINFEVDYGDAIASFSVHESRGVVAVKCPGVDEALVLIEAQMLPSPQDLRFAVATVKAMIDSRAILLHHIAELKTICIVRTKSARQLELRLINDTSIQLSIHPAYPQVPQSVRIEEIVGADGSTSPVLQGVQVAANAKCFGSIIDLFKFINGPKLLGR